MGTILFTKIQKQFYFIFVGFKKEPRPFAVDGTKYISGASHPTVSWIIPIVIYGQSLFFKLCVPKNRWNPEKKRAIFLTPPHVRLEDLF